MSKPKTAAEAMDIIFKRGSTSSPTAKNSSKKTQFTATKKDCGCGSLTGSTDATKLNGIIKQEQ